MPTVLYIIGVGYAGSIVSLELAKKLAKILPINDISDKVLIRTIDTSRDSIDIIRSKIMKDSIPDSIIETLHIGSINFVNDYLSNPKTIFDVQRDSCNWFPADKYMRDISGIARGGAGVGRNRLFARFLIDCVPGLSEYIKNTIMSDFRQISENIRARGYNINDYDIVIFLIFGAGGGTGSGMFLPILRILNDVIQEFRILTKIFPIMVLPIDPSDGEIIVSNGYAAFKDLACSVSIDPRAASSISMPMIVGFSERQVLRSGAENLHKYIDEKIVNFIITIHNVPIHGEGETRDWNNVVPEPFSIIRENYRWNLPLTIIDSVQVQIPTDDLFDYLELRAEYDNLVLSLTPTNVSETAIHGLIAEPERGVENLLDKINLFLEKYNIVTKQLIINKLLDIINNNIEKYKVSIKRGITGTILDGLLSLQRLSGINSTTREELDRIIYDIRDYSGSNRINQLIDNNFINRVENWINQAIREARIHCENKLFFRGRCLNRVVSIESTVRSAIQQYRGEILRYKVLEQLQTNLTLKYEVISNMVRDVRSRVNELRAKIDDIEERITAKGNRNVDVTPNLYTILFTKDGLSRLYERHVKPVAIRGSNFDRDKVRETIRRVLQRGLHFFVEPGEGEQPYVTLDRQRLLNTLQNAIRELRDLPVSVNGGALTSAIQRGITSTYIWILSNSEDERLFQNVDLENYYPNAQVSRLSSQNIGPRVFAALVINPVDARIVIDIVEDMKKAYYRSRSELRHAYIEAYRAEVDIDADKDKFDQACKVAAEQLKIDNLRI